jgi:hypothetical protein
MAEVVPAAPDSISDFTLRWNLPAWMDNLAENLQAIRKGQDIIDLPKKEKEPCIIVGAGPSLKYFNHLELIRKSGWKHPVFSCDKILGECLRHKIVPYATATVDGSPIVHGFYTAGIVKKYAPQVNALFSVLVHPTVANTYGSYNGPIYWYVPLLDMPVTADKKLDVRSLSYILSLLTKHQSLISGIGNVGAFLWNVAYELGCDPIILVGFDFSEQLKDKADAVYFNQLTGMYLQKTKDPKLAQDKAAALHQLESNPDFIAEKTGEGWLKAYYEKGQPVRYLVNPIWKHYRNLLAQHIVTSKLHTINATGNGCLHTEAKEKDNYILKADNFEAMDLRDVLEEYK